MRIKNRLKCSAIRAFMRMSRLIHRVDKNKVLFESFNGKSYSDNPRAVSEALQKLDNTLDIVWAFHDPEAKKEFLPEGIRAINRNSKRAYYRELATCGTFVTNFVLPNVPKSKRQFFIQTWHGDRGFKKILLDSRATFVPEQVRGYCDLAVSGSRYGDVQFTSSFGYSGEILRVGTPRNDCLVKQDKLRIQEIRKSLSIPDSAKILLYAPTFRDRPDMHQVKQNMQDIDLSATLNCLKGKYGGDWVCLVRAHPSMRGLRGLETSDVIIDASSYEDMGDLLLVSDLLITDYSSSAGDFPLLNRAVILFQPDKHEYVENSRALCFEMDSSPFYVAETQAELEQTIERLTDDGIQENCKAILDFYDTFESGNAANCVAERIVEHIKGARL